MHMISQGLLNNTPLLSHETHSAQIMAECSRPHTTFHKKTAYKLTNRLKI